MQPDMVMDYPKLLEKGYVWRVHVELPMQDTPGDDIYEYTVTVDVVSPTQALAQYIASTIYPDSSLFVSLMNPSLPDGFPHTAPEGYSYYVQEFKRNVVSIWLLHHATYSYSSDPISTIWGFCQNKNNKEKHYAHLPCPHQL